MVLKEYKMQIKFSFILSPTKYTSYERKGGKMKPFHHILTDASIALSGKQIMGPSTMKHNDAR